MPSPPPRMNIVGSGKLGRTLARLLSDAGVITIGAIYNRKAEHSRSARAFIGAGNIADNLEQLSDYPAPLWILATPDAAIHSCAQQLAACADIDWRGSVVFHSSGLKTSAELAPLQDLGSAIASAHPAHSFASPERSLTRFASTVCTLEGDAPAIEQLGRLFSAIGGQTSVIDASAKPLYHAATVMASNYLVALLGSSQSLLAEAGIDEGLAAAILAPLMQQSLQNGLKVGPVNALTGPIARGDIETLQTHLDAIEQAHPDLLNAYTSMGAQALKLARQQGSLKQQQLTAMAQLFETEKTTH
ncbi:hypothetical protein A9Q89_10360 [Gammaproteobacteria bacterium 53_120_T64]|nr:hypothetical protein A9Q89_10360 [Gammaproteobacteria bacterium 53_120_T64]